MTKLNVDEVFTYQPPDPTQIEALKQIRLGAKTLAHAILDETPVCADQQAALRLLRECMMTANAAIALRGAV